MAGNTTNVTIRMDAEIKAQADALFNQLGMSLTTAINIFVRQALREERIPFPITATPRPKALDEMTKEELDAILLNAIAECERGESYSLEEVFDELMEGLEDEQTSTSKTL